MDYNLRGKDSKNNKKLLIAREIRALKYAAQALVYLLADKLLLVKTTATVG
jgi:hypothetical protein